jgi:hypothetical protein
LAASSSPVTVHCQYVQYNRPNTKCAHEYVAKT